MSPALLATGTLFWLDALMYVYWSIIFVGHAFDYYIHSRSEEFRALTLETQLMRAQLQALKAQLEPHFLFNALQGIQTYMHEDVEKADGMITRLGDFLRSTLRDADEQEIPLRRELETLKNYLDVERMRFENGLMLDLDVDQEVMDARVPNLILQPLVENAVRHGIAAQSSDGRIGIKASRAGDCLYLQVRDNGPGLSPLQDADKKGIGLANTRARLEHLYGVDHEFELKNAFDGGLVVDIRIPYRNFRTAENTNRS